MKLTYTNMPVQMCRDVGLKLNSAPHIPEKLVYDPREIDRLEQCVCSRRLCLTYVAYWHLERELTLISA